MIVTTVDITKDSVCDIQAKLFHQATDGKRMINAWEAPMPAALQVLSMEQAVEWGTEAMRCIATSVSRTPNRRGTRRVSSMRRFAQRSRAEPFHGYRSEPVKAPAFKFNEPVGPVATAVKAAGELAAIAKFHGEDDTPVWDLLNGSWGIDVSNVKKYVMPDLSASSEKDLIKFVRSPSHMLYGFNNHSPTVSISLGKYRPETMDKNYTYDWHAFAIALRFQGEYISRYQGGFKFPGQYVAYAPAYAEGSPYQRTSVTENIEVRAGRKSHSALDSIVDVTLKHYQGEMEKFGVRSSARFGSMRAKISTDVDIDISVLNEMAARKSRVSVHLPKNAIKIKHERPAYDITESRKDTFQRTLASTANRYGDHYIPTWKSIHALVWELAFRMNLSKTSAVIQFLRMTNTYAALEEEAQKIFRESLISAIPVDFGNTMMTVLRIMSPTENKAVLEFFDMLSELSLGSYNATDTDWSTLYLEAVVASPDVTVLASYISMGYRRYTSLVHSAGNIICRNTPGLSVHENFTVGLSNYCTERLDYWAQHYSSRVADYRLTLERLEAVKRDRGLTWDKGLSPYPGMKSMVGDLGMFSDETIVGFQCGCRYGTVVYAYLSRCYKASEVQFDSRFNATVRINASKYGSMMKAVASNYIRKRAGRYKATSEANIERIISKIDTLNRHADINNYLDGELKPTITWVSLYTTYLSKIAVTERSIKRTLMARLENSKAAADSSVIEEVGGMVIDTLAPPSVEYVAKKPGSDNRFAALAYSDSEDDSVDSNIIRDASSDGSSEDSSSTDDTPVLAENASLSVALQDVTSVDVAKGIVYDGAALAMSDFGEMFGDDDDEVDYDGVSMRNYIMNSVEVPYNQAAFDEYLSDFHDTADDVTVSMASVGDEMRRYAGIYHKSRANRPTTTGPSEGNIDIV